MSSKRKPDPQRVKKDPLDRYYTPAWVTELLVEDWPFPDTVQVVWEPCAGRGDIAYTLAHANDKIGCTVYLSDVDEDSRGMNHDFLHGEKVPFTNLWYGLCDKQVGIVTNPPYSIPGATAADFVRKALEYTPYVAMLLRVAWIEGCKERIDIFRDNPPAEIRVIIPRVHFTGPNEGVKKAPNGPSAWFIWKPGSTGAVMTWIGGEE